MSQVGMETISPAAWPRPASTPGGGSAAAAAGAMAAAWARRSPAWQLPRQEPFSEVRANFLQLGQRRRRRLPAVVDALRLAEPDGRPFSARLSSGPPMFPCGLRNWRSDWAACSRFWSRSAADSGRSQGRPCAGRRRLHRRLAIARDNLSRITTRNSWTVVPTAWRPLGRNSPAAIRQTRRSGKRDSLVSGLR